MTAQQYIISFLLNESSNGFEHSAFYGTADSAPTDAKVIIVRSNFFDDGIYGTPVTLPKTPLAILPGSDIPFLFGEPRVERTDDGRIVLYADLVASAYFMLSRYEEVIKPRCRDQWGRFLAKDSVVFQQGYGLRPLVDEWGLYLRNLLRKAGIDMPEEKRGFRKIYLTHDVDHPFSIISIKDFVFQFLRTILFRPFRLKKPVRAYLTGEGDPFYTFPDIIRQDNGLKEKLPAGIVESVYFIISACPTKNNDYYPVTERKYKRMLSVLQRSGAKFGLHVSHEGGLNPEVISEEIERLPSCVDKANLYSRHHYLRWREPEHIEQMEEAGIKEDFTLGFADSAGFRMGTCRPYKFINPMTKTISGVIIHPMEIMECSLKSEIYMALAEKEALELCTKIIKEVCMHNGELVVLFHNSSFVNDFYYTDLYKKNLSVLADLGTKVTSAL